ncbi:methylated-DNA--[protein]-cysteine S-methyltransferase [Ideonella dechloratans]|uniref:Methylated-DNA--protein-cysteine methyltransferase n=1 Tax=Ideonella dechloratans TaxID=36863 RepID=A0A643FAV2_IDEDE|nr:methylated-DNA--[protein]-cysteine S-methyltransferase [Ideonella dechloratans]KAB0579508.1 methylated-DNA--[protein]-cysteine S-methyltransferase [Ideonella dechloratans]UFU11616.1 methylated-DNA--[protein]-cysteine S-methyltransferase [Ideonella dechloratans]
MSLSLHRDWVAQTLVDTPLGPLRLAASTQGLGGAWFEDQKHHPGPLDAPAQAGHPVLAQARDELDAYWRAPREARFTTPLDPAGTAFQRAVWAALRALAPGQTCSYGALARQLQQAQAVRAVAAAVGRNPLSIFIPCHRVLGADGSLTGYAGGLARKRALLHNEGVPLPAELFTAT